MLNFINEVYNYGIQRWITGIELRKTCFLYHGGKSISQTDIERILDLETEYMEKIGII